MLVHEKREQRSADFPGIVRSLWFNALRPFGTDIPVTQLAEVAKIYPKIDLMIQCRQRNASGNSVSGSAVLAGAAVKYAKNVRQTDVEAQRRFPGAVLYRETQGHVLFFPVPLHWNSTATKRSQVDTNLPYRTRQDPRQRDQGRSRPWTAGRPYSPLRAHQRSPQSNGYDATLPWQGDRTRPCNFVMT